MMEFPDISLSGIFSYVGQSIILTGCKFLCFFKAECNYHSLKFVHLQALNTTK